MLDNFFVNSLYEAVLDTVKVLPILFLAYLLVSFLSHDHNHKFSKFLAKNKKLSVCYAAFLGCVPQCGFSSVIADLYSEKKLSIGTLIAVFVATSDEAIPLMLSNPDSFIDMLILIGIKILLAVFWGYLIDLTIHLFTRKQKTTFKVETEHNHEGYGHEHDHSCGHIHCEHCEDDCGHEHGKCCVNNVFLDAFIHTFNIMIYIFVATFVINLIIEYCGMEVLQNLLTTNIYIQILIASLIGLIPNCASSVLLVELFLTGTLGFPALLAGLTAGAGVGMVILWTRNRKKTLQNLAILVGQYLIGVISGLFISIFF